MNKNYSALTLDELPKRLSQISALTDRIGTNFSEWKVTEVGDGNLNLVFIVIGADSFLKQDPENLSKILTNPTDIIGKMNDLFITNLVLIFIIIASASTNLVDNFIPSQYTLINFNDEQKTLVEKTNVNKKMSQKNQDSLSTSAQHLYHRASEAFL